jgi:hypothetical protein
MLNVYNLYTKDGIHKYKLLLFSFGINDPFCLPDYINIFSGGMNNLICFSFITRNNGLIIMPGYLNPIVIAEQEIEYFDFISPYGYTGPFFSKEIVESDIHSFWMHIDNWYLDNNVVTEFIRFNLSGNQLHYTGKIFPTMLNIKGKIINEENQWSAFDHKVRKNVNKAIRENISSKVFYIDIPKDKILEFHIIYIQTMKRTGANENFFYTIEEFEKFINENKEYVAICTIYFQGIPISSELLLISNDSIYSFLGGTDEMYFDKRPNDFLKFEALNWARNNGKKYYILGGGHGFEDGIFKYKKSFFPNDFVYYYTGRKILNITVYNELLKRRNGVRNRSGLTTLVSEDESFFPLYNKVN